uniref:Uncharacterized protein n=1 Tax=Aegilops tauschii subsp. strangulata TaxID=200361 RepID=A0A452Z398_AEGTS
MVYKSLFSGPKIASAFLSVSSLVCLCAFSSFTLARNALNCS